MTTSGETVTQKEILAGSYLVLPGVLPDKDFLDLPNAAATLLAEETVAPQKQVLPFSEFHFQHYVVTDAPAGKIKFSAAADFVLMQFCLNGKYRYSDKSTKKNISFKPTEYNGLCIPQGKELIFSYEAGKLELVAIYLEKSFLLKYIPTDHVLSQKVNATALEVLNPDNLTLQPKLQGVLHDILNCEFEGHLKKLYTRAKLIELLALQIAQLEEEKSEAILLKQADINKMRLVKNLIENNLNKSFSLSTLAKAVFTNEQYLKKHFKLVFGCTVFNYILGRRMEKAKEMLLAGDHKIAEVAEQTGYKHATHFTSAFKKYFGFLPNQVRATAYFLLSEFSLFEGLFLEM
ncbi:MAG: helix-turn-helix domain-containing protein [Adhaeribacter sp.]